MSKVRVLIVEDEALQAMLAEDMVVELGYDPVGPAATVADALELIESEVVDCAMLDVNLLHERSDAVARRLAERSIPFFYISGDLAVSVMGDGGRGRSAMPVRQAVLPKPYSFDALGDALDACILKSATRRPH